MLLGTQRPRETVRRIVDEQWSYLHSIVTKKESLLFSMNVLALISSFPATLPASPSYENATPYRSSTSNDQAHTKHTKSLLIHRTQYFPPPRPILTTPKTNTMQKSQPRFQTTYPVAAFPQICRSITAETYHAASFHQFDTAWVREERRSTSLSSS